jgi:hypothetical protein
MTTNTRNAMWMPVLPVRLLSLLRLLSLYEAAMPMGALMRRPGAGMGALALSGGEEGARCVSLRAGDSLHVQQGVLWLTRSGDAQDHVLAAGQCWQAEAAQQVWLGAASAAGCRVLRLRKRPFA